MISYVIYSKLNNLSVPLSMKFYSLICKVGKMR